MAHNHLIRKLFKDLEELDSVALYPAGVLKVPNLILGTSFFPGGVGLWCEDQEDVPQVPRGEIMVLGHNFDKVSGYEKSLANHKEEIDGPTWGNLRPLLRNAGIELKDCFFTNAYMGLKAEKATGPFVRSRNRDFVEWCQRFFIRQLDLQRPKAVLALGSHVPKFLGPLSPQLSQWSKLRTLKRIDEAKLAVIRNVSFDALPNHKCAVVCLIHPCLRPGNIWRRDRGGLDGNKVEIQMIRKAVFGH
ncbi:MAG TPA: hypothetical protein VHY91_23465 [Pirellulales bacterium]|nr:hypothetical protein [Pirellulales bacterium]